MYDFQLDQFGIRRDDNETFSQALDRVLRSDFLSHNDNAFLDLTIDRSLEINDGISTIEGVYYFSYAGNRTVPQKGTDNFVPSPLMWGLFHPGAAKMGRYTVSALYPTHSDGSCLAADGSRGWKNFNPYTDKSFRTGIWYVMPVQSLDHLQFIGGILNGSIINTRTLYLDIVRDIYRTYP